MNLNLLLKVAFFEKRKMSSEEAQELSFLLRRLYAIEMVDSFCDDVL